jgi:hypothetical protein
MQHARPLQLSVRGGRLEIVASRQQPPHADKKVEAGTLCRRCQGRDINKLVVIYTYVCCSVITQRVVVFSPFFRGTQIHFCVLFSVRFECIHCVMLGNRHGY